MMELVEIIKNNIPLVGMAVVAVIILIWWLAKHGKMGIKNVVYIQKNDPSAQKNYDENRGGEKPLTLKERLELSWQFLYDITDIVLSKFSQADQETALGLGKTLLENGGHYEHVIDYGIKHNLGRGQSKGGGMSKSA